MYVTFSNSSHHMHAQYNEHVGYFVYSAYSVESFLYSVVYINVHYLYAKPTVSEYPASTVRTD